MPLMAVTVAHTYRTPAARPSDSGLTSARRVDVAHKTASVIPVRQSGVAHEVGPGEVYTAPTPTC